MKKFGNFVTNIVILDVWLAIYCNSNSKKNLEKLRKFFYQSKRDNVLFTLFAY